VQLSVELNREPRLPGLLARGPKAAIVTEIAIVLGILCIGTWLGTLAVRAFRADGGVQQFYQSEFGPAVLLACGRGFHNPDTRSAPALAAFLSQASDAFDCRALPEPVAMLPWTPFQAASSYLELAVALMWKATGVSWSGLALLNGGLFGLVAALTFCVFRLALSRVLALLAMLPALMWAPNIMLAPQLRDYAKGPFLLAIILIVGALADRETDRRRAFIWSSLAGVVVGVGVGFRTDLLIALVPPLVTIGFLLPMGVSIRSRTIAAAIFLGSFLIVASPALRGYARGGNTGHVVLLGLATDFDRTLRIRPSLYEFGQYNDTLAFSIINGFAIRVGGQRAGVDLSTAEYDRASMAYLCHLAGTFPADVVTRTLSAIRVVPRYFLDSSLEVPAWSHSSLLRTMYWLRGGVSARLALFAVPAVIAAILGVALVNPRAALAGMVVIVVFAGGAAIQFHERHFYYLQFVPWLAFGVIAQAGLQNRFHVSRLSGLQVKRSAAVGAAIVGAAAVAILLSRGIQQQTARRLFEEYASAPRTPLSIEPKGAGSNVIRLAAPEWAQPMPPDASRVTTRFLAVEFRDRQCRRTDVDLTVRYEAVYPDADLTETINVPLHPAEAEPTVAFLAVFDRADESVRFRGIETAADRADCVGAVSRVDGLGRTPLLLNTVLSAGWRTLALYQRLQ